MQIPDHLGDYAIKRLYSEGPPTDVYEGVDTKLGHRVAIKVLRCPTPFRKAMFLRVGRALANIDSPHIAQVFTVGEVGEYSFIAMPFPEGESLAHLLKQHGPLHAGDAAEAIRQAAQGLLELQKLGIVHRDISPSNLTISGSELAVTDFGLGHDPDTLLSPPDGIYIGKPHYVAPELQMDEAVEAVDAKTDVYSLGCSLFHLCSGRPPFHAAAGFFDLVRLHHQPDRPELKLVVQGFDKQLSDLCRQMMDRRPEHRPTLEQLAATLEKISTRLGGELPPRHVEVTLQPTRDDFPIQPVQSTRKAVVFALVLVALTMATFVMCQG